jgi:hypothetical protein
MGAGALVIIGIVIALPFAVLWVRGLDKMSKDHPEYKGEDLFGDDEEKSEKNN